MRSGLRCAFEIFACLAMAIGAIAQGPATKSAELLTRENVVHSSGASGPWAAAAIGQRLATGDRLRTGELSRALIRLTDLSLFQLDELSKIQIAAPTRETGKATLDLSNGAMYFFSREKPRDLEIRTPVASGALRGTEFHLAVGAGGKTVLTMFDGAVELRNARGSVVVSSGEQGVVELGRAPYKTAVIEAENIIQWCLYYPGVVDPAELKFTPAEEKALAASLRAYRQGDLLGALTTYPAGRGTSDAELVYRAALWLVVGQVERARLELARTQRSRSQASALRQLIAAVKFQEFIRRTPPSSASEWMAESYYQQSRSNLEGALHAARRAAELAPEFGFAATRVAELEFSFGRTLKAMKVLERGLELAPRNAQAHALLGFLLSAENRMGAARRSFDAAIALDPALGNAWLGRGLTFIRQGREAEGRLDLQTAAALEPNRSILRSYLGKAFSQTGDAAKASAELMRAQELDPHDPTPWLYSAIQKKQENRYNEAIDDLEHSLALNNNRRVYRSQFLLDQDRAVRGTNLAAIYQNNGMAEQSVREAIRAVQADYTSAAAHRFLANSYDARRDPSFIQLRFESAAINELLLSHLLAPVGGGGSLSFLASQQEYSRMFEADGLGFSTAVEYRATGDLRTATTQFGRAGNVEYALDAQYRYDRGDHPNGQLQSLDTAGVFKLQLGPQDSVLFLATAVNASNGDVFLRYDPREARRITGNVSRPGQPTRVETVPNENALSYRFREKQDPGLLLLGWNHQWAPGHHTLLLLGRLAVRQEITQRGAPTSVLRRETAAYLPEDLEDGVVNRTVRRDARFFEGIQRFAGVGQLESSNNGLTDSEYGSHFKAESAELQHVLTLGPHTAVLGARYQQGHFDTQALLTNFFANYGRLPLSFDNAPFATPLAQQTARVGFKRETLYLYDLWEVAPWLSVTAGLAYDRLLFPENFRNPPLSERQRELERLSPKAGAILQPWVGATLRSAYAQAIGGASFDDSIRLEPTQVAGFIQSYRTLASESLFGSVAASRYELYGFSFEQKLPSRTWLGVDYQARTQIFDQTVGVFDAIISNDVPIANVPSLLLEKDRYREREWAFTVHQLLGERWSLGLRYRHLFSEIEQRQPQFRAAIQRTQNPANAANLAPHIARSNEAQLHQLSLRLIYNHPTGFFFRAEADWFQQENDLYRTTGRLSRPDDAGLARPILGTRHEHVEGESFWHFNAFAGYRFHRNQCELGVGLLNATGQDYRLNPLNPYDELPRRQTFVIRCQLNF